MRSSIACIKCRKSKTKCDNKGLGSTCSSCATSGKECIYPSPATVGNGSLQRRESLGATGEHDGPPKKRKKPLAPTTSAATGSREGLGTYDNALESPLLTPTVWKELFEIYEKHFATDFPFLHKRTFLSSLQHPLSVASPECKAESPTSIRFPHAPLLLAFLTQTARFHPELVSQMGSPSATSEFYAEATRRQMAYDFPGEPSLEKTQALLMLGFHEWNEVENRKGWVKIRTAISCAQALGCQYDADLDDIMETVAKEGEEKSSEKDKFIKREIQRRTFWSCFIMDRYLSCGKDRPQMLNVEDLQRIQLPCSDKAFNHGQKVRTRFLGEDDEKYQERRERLRRLNIRRHEERNGIDQDHRPGSHIYDIKWEVGEHEGELSWYIQAVEHFAKVMKWCVPPGRRRLGEKNPWDDDSTFKKLENDQKRLKDALPSDLQLTPENTEDHIYARTWRNYVLIHALYSLCTISLYREYMAFAPWRLLAPQGPLDEPLITDSPPSPDYWANQARACFGAARGFADLLQSCQSLNVLVETPIAGFTTYIVAWCALYCHNFPRMDPDRALDSRLQQSVWKLSNNIILSMEVRFKIARVWIGDLQYLHDFWRESRAEYKAAGGSPESTTSDSGGGLKHYFEHFERPQKEFGSFHNNRSNLRGYSRTVIVLQHDQGSNDKAEVVGSSAIAKHERGPAPPKNKPVASSTFSPSFTPVNATTNPVTPESVQEQYAPTANYSQTYGLRLPNHTSHTDSTYTFNSYSQPYTSPNQSYQNGTVPFSSHSISELRATQTTHHVQDSGPVTSGPGPYTSSHQQGVAELPSRLEQINNMSAGGGELHYLAQGTGFSGDNAEAMFMDIPNTYYFPQQQQQPQGYYPYQN